MLTSKKVKLDLVGIDGNAFAIMAAFKQAARRQGVDHNEVEAVIKQCMSGDYDNLLQTIIEHIEDPE